MRMRRGQVTWAPALIIGGAAGLLLTACATGPSPEIARNAQTALVGMPKQALLSCAGVPDRQAQAGGREYYTYVQRPTGGYGPSTSVGIGGGSSSGVGLGLGFGLPLGGGGSPGCEATFVLDNGIVQQVSYPGNVSLSDCSAIVQNCMPAPAS